MTGTQVDSHRRTGQGGNCLPPKFWKTMEIIGQMLGKIKKIRADISENRLNSGNFITILHKNSGKRSTAPLESIIPVRLCRLESQYSATRLESNTKNDATPVNRPQMTRFGLDLFISAANDSSQLNYNLLRDSSRIRKMTRVNNPK